MFYGIPLDKIDNLLNQDYFIDDMKHIDDPDQIFLIKPFRYDISNDEAQPESKHENNYYDMWNNGHVCMPCSPFNVFNDGTSKWSIIEYELIQLREKCLNKKVTVYDIKKTLEQINRTNFQIETLQQLIENVYSDDERINFMSNVLPKMISFVLDLPIICGQPPPLLTIGKTRSLTMSQVQVASLLCSAFFCLFPPHFDENIRRTYQSINLTNLFQIGSSSKLEKLRCILHYFTRICQQKLTGVITYKRSFVPLDSIPDFTQSTKPLSNIHLSFKTDIEKYNGLLQVDFANQFIGGGVLNEGNVQEEIRFSICPEMLLSILICQVMKPNECIYLIGCQQFLSYNGYGSSFKADQDFIDKTPKDKWGRKLINVVGMDAIYYSNPVDQYNLEDIHRELIKSFVSFQSEKEFNNKKVGIATGKWGCGAFNGDPQLKALIQLISSSENDRPIVFACWNDQHLFDSLANIYQYFIDKKATVKHVYLYIKHFIRKNYQMTLFDFILTTPIEHFKSM